MRDFRRGNLQLRRQLFIGRLAAQLLREHLGIDRWLVVGVSWGVTLALVYAQAHPDRVTGMVLAAVTSGTRRETDWITRDMGRVFPREVGVSLDGPARQTRNGFGGRATESDDEMKAHGFDVRVDLLPDGRMPACGSVSRSRGMSSWR